MAWILIIGLLVFYMLPTVICNVRKTEHSDAIALINLFFGWTVLGWIAALLWAVTDKEHARRSQVANADPIAGSALEYIKQGWRDTDRGEGLKVLGRAIFGERKQFDKFKMDRSTKQHNQR